MAAREVIQPVAQRPVPGKSPGRIGPVLGIFVTREKKVSVGGILVTRHDIQKWQEG
jgi:hypothetical protein